MFSPDNFYDFFITKYGWDSHRVMPWIPESPGDKDIKKWIPSTIDVSERNQKNGLAKYSVHGVVILHDQEPFFSGMLDIYREKINQSLNDSLGKFVDNENYFLRHWNSCSWPVFCHSEKNSKDIDWLKSIGVIDCHYFYHGLISRDWFRHWKHHPGLSPKTTWKQRFLLYVRDVEGSREYRKKVLEDLVTCRAHIKHNWDQKSTITSDYSAKIVVPDAQETGIHLVAETVFDDGKIHLTEKIFKPIVMCQPFIIYAGPGALDYLKSYGFKTFSDIWDESYDLEPDHDRRRAMIKKLVEDLCSIDDQKFCEILEKCLSIVEYNQKHFYSDDFEKILLDELDSNIISAYSRQKELLEKFPGGSFFYSVDCLIKQGINFSQHKKISPRFHHSAKYLKNTIIILQSQHPSKWEEIRRTYKWADTIV